MRKVEILVIEDNPTDRLWLEFVLQEIAMNYSCSSVTDGEQAVDFLLKRGKCATAPTPELIFLDAHLPKLDGVEILRQVPHAEKLPICVLTSSEKDRKIFREEFGIEDSNYLIKPVNTRAIKGCSCVRDHLHS
jgi:CheY-like chemotaxis protein